MVKIMGQFNGLGLSAIQVGEPVRVMVMCVEEDKVPLVLINPVISKTSEKTELMKEGCLSFPGIMSKVERNTKITVDYRDSFGNLYIRDLDGVFAQCAQHEIDHMNGVLFVEKVSPLYKLSLKDKLKRRRF
jgi:peptide deformylase